jgi:hydroxyacyl-ACP dehydratase HTD2-like protein with hotdog domain
MATTIASSIYLDKSHVTIIKLSFVARPHEVARAENMGVHDRVIPIYISRGAMR